MTYQPPTATDQVDGPLPVTCNPRLRISISDRDDDRRMHGQGQRRSPQRDARALSRSTVTVVGQPTITVPNPGPVVDATKATGAVVTYAASAKDAVGNPIPVTCAPRFGQLLPARR